jgi:hypothetical protein
MTIKENKEFQKWLVEWIASIPKGELLLASPKTQEQEQEEAGLEVQKSAGTVDVTVTKAA